MATQIYRQGDVLFIKSDNTPQGTVQPAPLVIQHGESGHVHRTATPSVELRTVENQRWIVAPTEWTVTHEEHDTITIPPGTWQVVIERDYTPQGIIRQVID